MRDAIIKCGALHTDEDDSTSFAVDDNGERVSDSDLISFWLQKQLVRLHARYDQQKRIAEHGQLIINNAVAVVE